MNKKLNALALSVLALATTSFLAFGANIAMAAATTVTETSPIPVASLELEHAEADHDSELLQPGALPADIRGSMTLRHIADFFNIDAVALLTQARLAADIPLTLRLSDIKTKYAVEMEIVRTAVADILNPPQPVVLSLDDDFVLETEVHTTHAPALPSESLANTISGSMTLRQIVDRFKLSSADLIAKIGLPQDTSLDITVRQLKDTTGKETQAIRVAVDELLK